MEKILLFVNRFYTLYKSYYTILNIILQPKRDFLAIIVEINIFKVYNITMKTILHCDANNFFASVEIKLNPELRGKPIAVSGNPEKRHGIVLAKSEEAKKYGVKTAEPLWQAKQKCPDIIFVSPHYDEYVDFSSKLFNLYSEYTDQVEPFGIDECWLDCTASTRLFGDGETIANTLRERIKNELGLTISAGVSFTKIFAKLGSDYKKPDATTIITPDNYKEIVWPLPVSDLLMVGGRSAKLFQKLNIKTIGDLANYDIRLLTRHLGINAEKLHSYANGIEVEDVKFADEKDAPKSIGNSTTTPFDVKNQDEALAVIVSLSEMVSARLKRHGLYANGIGVSIRYASFDSVQKTNVISYPTNTAEHITDEAMKLLTKLHSFDSAKPIRQLGVYAYKLSESNTRQLTLFDDDAKEEKTENIEKSVDEIRQKYGPNSLQKGIVLKHNELCDGLYDKKFKPFKKPTE